MPLHPLAAQFESVADAYERGRPEYPLAAVGALAAELGLGPGAAVLDLAAGTGKLSRRLLAVGLDVTAVEPLPSMRELLARRIGAERVRDGVAERIPLTDASVDAVTVGDAFHWFDQPAALAEIARVLRPGGGLAVLRMIPDWSGASWAHQLGSLLAGLRPEHPQFDGPGWQEPVRAAGGWSEAREIRVTTSQPTGTDTILDYLESMSWVAAMPDHQRPQALQRMRAIVDAGETPAELANHVVIGLTARV